MQKKYVTKEERKQRAQKSMENSIILQTEMRDYYLRLMTTDPETIGLDYDMMYNYCSILQKHSLKELEYLKECVLQSESMWESFEACEFIFDLLVNTNKTLTPNRISFTDTTCKIADDYQRQGMHLMAIAKYYQGLITYPTEAKFYSNLMVGFLKTKKYEVGYKLYENVSNLLSNFVPENEQQYVEKGTEILFKMIELENAELDMRDQQILNSMQRMMRTDDSDDDTNEIDSENDDDFQPNEQVVQTQNVVEERQTQTEGKTDQDLDDGNEVEFDDEYEMPIEGFVQKQKDMTGLYHRAGHQKLTLRKKGQQIYIFNNKESPKIKQWKKSSNFKERVLLRMIYAMKRNTSKNGKGRQILEKQSRMSIMIYKHMKSKNIEIVDKKINPRKFYTLVDRARLRRQLEEKMFQQELKMERRVVNKMWLKERYSKLPSRWAWHIKSLMGDLGIKYKKPRRRLSGIDSSKVDKLTKWWIKRGGNFDFKKFCDRNVCMVKFYQIQEQGKFLTIDQIRQLALNLATKQGSDFSNNHAKSRIILLESRDQSKQQNQGYLGRNTKCSLEKSDVAKCLSILLSDKHRDIACSQTMIDQMRILDESLYEDSKIDLCLLLRLSRDLIQMIASYL